MRVKTNLSSEELALVGRGLSLLAKSQRSTNKAFPTDNPAEKELLRRISAALDTSLDVLQQGVSSALLD